MANFVEDMRTYDDVIINTSESVVKAFECVMEAVASNTLEQDELYTAAQMSNKASIALKSPVLTAMVARGLLHCDGKRNGKNVYAITEEIYDYYINCFKPSKEHYKNEMNAFWASRKKKS